MKLIDADALVRNMLKAYREYGAEYMRNNYMKFIYNTPAFDSMGHVYCPLCGAKMNTDKSSTE